MRKLIVAAALSLLVSGAFAADRVKTRLTHLSGTPLVLVVSTIPAEIVSITCESWTMLGVGSYKGHNEFTIPAAPENGAAIAVLDSTGFNGYCKDPRSIMAHTDEGDFVGVLDRGPGNWDASTKLTFTK